MRQQWVRLPEPERRFGPKPLTPVQYLILIALTVQVSHGFAIGRDMFIRTGRQVKPGKGSLYLSMRQLEERGFIKLYRAKIIEEWEDKRRHRYQITLEGRAAAIVETERLTALVNEARHLGLISAYPPVGVDWTNLDKRDRSGGRP